MPGPGKGRGGIPGAESGKAVEDAGLGVAEGGTGKGRDAGGETGGDEGERRAVCREGNESTESAERGKGENSEKQRGNMGNEEGGGLDTGLDCMPLVHVGRSFRLAVGLMTILTMACAILAPWAWVVAVCGLAAYPLSAAWSFYPARRPGSAPPVDMAPASLALCGASMALIVSPNSVLAGLLSAAFGVVFCGMSTGQWLLVVAKRRNAGLRGAVGAVWQLGGQANEQAWRAWSEEVRRCP